VIDFSKGDECTWLPDRRRHIIALSLVCMALFAYLQVARFVSVRAEVHSIVERVTTLENSMVHLEHLSLQLLDAERRYNHSLTTASESCVDPLAKRVVDLLTGTLQVQFNQVDTILQLVQQSFDTSKDILDEARLAIRKTGWKIIYYPFIPSFALLIGVFVILTTACFLWNRPRLMSNPRMQLTIKMLAPVMVIFMLTAGFAGALAFFSSIVVSGYCLQIDDNVVEGLKRLDFSEIVHEKVNVDAVLQHIGSYYVHGTNVNPLATLVQNFDAALYSVLRFYSLVKWVVEAGSVTCPGLKHLSPEPLVHSFLNSSHTAYDFFHARNIWPYYDKIVHQSICAHVPWNNLLFLLMAILVGFGFCPAIAISISNHLKHIGFELQRNSKLLELRETGIDLRQIDKAGVVIESSLDALDRQGQVVVLDNIISSRSKEVKSDLLELGWKLQRGEDTGPSDSNEDSD